jgi:nucleoside 2-deoxyribosyltransferase
MARMTHQMRPETPGSSDTPAKGLDAFVSMPFSPEFDNVFLHGILGVGSHLQEYQLNWIRLDREAYKQRLIEQNVLKHIDMADFMVADISRYPNQGTANVSVMHEIGYACGRGVPFILIGKNGTHKNLPSNLKGSIVTEYQSETEPALKDFSRRLSLQIRKTLHEEVLHSPHGGFRVEGFAGRSKLHLPELIKRAEHRINILTTNLNYTDIHLKESVVRALEENKKNPVFRVEILTMDPESDVANARAVQLGKTSVRQYRDELRKSLDNVRKALAKYRNVEIITYRSLPTQMTFIIDTTVIVAVVSLGQQSRDGIHFVLSDVNTSAAPFQNHFILLKNSAAVQG